MSIFLPLLAAAGACLFFSGLPPARRQTLGRDSAPFLKHLLSERGISVLHPSGSDARWKLPLSEVDRSTLVSRLAAAGASLSPEGFRQKQLVWACCGGGSIGALATWMGITHVGLDARAIPALVVIFSVAGFVLPDHLLVRATRRRKMELRSGLPVAIDLLTLCLMAGESVIAAFARVATAAPGVTGVEFGRVCDDVRSGSTTVEALEAFARRAGSPPVGRLVDALCIAMERGAPVAEVLRAQADDVRESERRDLLEMAGRREVVMLVPVVFLILPVVVLFVLYPGLVALDLSVP